VVFGEAAKRYGKNQKTVHLIYYIEKNFLIKQHIITFTIKPAGFFGVLFEKTRKMQSVWDFL